MQRLFKKVTAMFLSIIMLVACVPLTSLADTENTAQITIQYRDEEDNVIKEDKVITETYSGSGTYTLPDALKADFAVKTDSGYNLYKFNESKSDSTAPFDTQMTLTLVFNNTDEYAFYEDFEAYTVDSGKWHQEKGETPTLKDDNTKYLYHTTASSTTGGYMNFDEVNTTDKKVKITFDVKLTAPNGTGESQFTIGNTSPSFDSNQINYGAQNTAAGHIIHLCLKNGALKVNGVSADSAFIGDWMHVDADVDFGSKAADIKLTNDSGKEAEYKTTIFSTSYANNLGSFYMRSGGANGAIGFDNLRIKITGEAALPDPVVKSDINYKSIYAFGDSIVYGHNAPSQSFMRLIANDYANDLNMMAKNGATVIKSTNHILTQIQNAPATAPDFVVFDGYTNDAYEGINYGTPKGTTATTFDNTTFCGGFEEILYTMKQKWPTSKIVFITIHKSGARDFEIQTKLHDLTVDMCENWGVSVVDMFKDSTLDTRNADEMSKYIINGSGSHPNVACCREFYIPQVTKKLEAILSGSDEGGSDTPTPTNTPAPTNTPNPTEKPAATNKPVQTDADNEYISHTSGIKIVGDGVKPAIYIDENEYDGVKKAALSLAEDIEKVTGQTALTNPTDNELQNAKLQNANTEISDINFVLGTMTISNYETLTDNGRGVIAVYDNDVLSRIYLSDNLASSSNGTLNFTNLTDFPDSEVKGFLWKDDNGLTCIPLAGVYNYEQPSADGNGIIIGTIGKSAKLSSLIEDNEIDIRGIENKWEAFTIQKTSNNTIVIAGSDKRGTIFGVYDFCEKIGVSPWEFWADVKPQHTDELYVKLDKNGYTEGEPSVKYRGIFLNDEFNMNQWNNSEFPSGMNIEKYEKFYELILRLKMNFMWPAMHKYSTSFHNIDGAAAKADEYGVVVGSSHAEPLLRNNLGELLSFYNEWKEREENKDKPLYMTYDSNDLKADVPYVWTHYSQYESGVGVEGTEVYNCEFLEDYWRESVRENGQYDNIYTLGMRGVHDGIFSTNMDNETALKELIAKQIEILKEELVGEGKKYSRIEDVPMVYIPYKDVLEEYNKPDRLNLPEYVTIMWTDDNYGYMRQNSNDIERANSGRGGVYYHISYYGNPTSYLWLSSSQPGLMREQLTRSYEMGSDMIWIMNVGDLKPAEKEIEYYARLSHDIEGMNNTDISEVYKSMAKRDFGMGDKDAAEYADIMDTYYELANSKRPEFYRANDAANKLNLSLTAYAGEADRYINRYKDITERAEKLYEKLSEEMKPSFFELALYPIRSAKNMAVDYVEADKAASYKEQGKYGAAAKYINEANAAAAQIASDIKYYNEMLNGKWANMTNMNPSALQGCDAHLTTDFAPAAVTELDYTDMSVSETEMSLSKYDSYAKCFDISNTGYGSFDYEITTDNQAVKVSKTSGTVYSNEKIYITLDASKAESGTSQGTVTISEKIDNNVVKTERIKVSISNPADVTAEKTYIETDGVVSVEAEHYTSLADKGVYNWKIEKDFGRSGDSLKIYPNLSEDVGNTAAEMLSKSAAALYDIYFENAGTYNVNIYRMPTLNARGTCRVGIGLDDGNPTAIGGTNNSPTSTSESKVKTNAWPSQVLRNCDVLKTTVTVGSAGKHTLKLYNVSSGMVVDKIVLTKGDAEYSYFGAPESFNTTYNNKITMTETIADTEKDEDGITKTFEPKAVTGEPEREHGKITVPIYALTNITNAVVAVTSYDENGNMTSVDFEKVAFTDGAAQANLNLSSDAENYAVTVFDNFTDLHPIAPYREYGNIASDTGFASVNENMSQHNGKKSIVIIADTQIDENITAQNIKYLYGENVSANSYKKIPFNAQGGSKYYVRIGFDGENSVSEEFEASLVSYNIVRELKGDGDAKTTQLSNGISYSGSTVSVSDLPIVISDEGKYYVLSENADENFKREWKLTDDAEQTYKVTYTLDKNIVSYVEFEDFEKNIIENESYSNGKAGHFSDNTLATLITNPSAGDYELTASVVNNRGNGFKLKYGNNNDVDNTQWSPNIGLFSAGFTLADGSDLTKLQLSKNGTNSPTFDYIIIRRVPENTEYTVKAVTSDNAVLADITPAEMTSIKASGIPEVIEKDGKYYRVSDSMVGKNTHAKRITQTLSKGDTVNVEYTLDESILFYKEMEDYANTTVSESSSYSRGKAAYVAYNYYAELGNIEFPAGEYEFEGYVTGRGNAVGLRFKKNISDSANFMTIAYPLFDTDKQDTFTYRFELSEPTQLVMAGLSDKGSQAGTPTFDYIMIKKLS